MPNHSELDGHPEHGESAASAALPRPEEQPTVSVDVAGQALGIARSTAYEAVKDGTIPTIRIGRRLVVPTAALRQMLGLS